MVRVTFSLDDETVGRIRRTASRLGRPQSQIVREAIADFSAQSDRTSDSERLRLLGALETLGSARPSRSAAAVDAELGAIRRSRRTGGRRRSTS